MFVDPLIVLVVSNYMCLSTCVLIGSGFENFFFVCFGKVPVRVVHVPNWFA